jgi:hypothetical protein
MCSGFHVFACVALAREHLTTKMHVLVSAVLDVLLLSEYEVCNTVAISSQSLWRVVRAGKHIHTKCCHSWAWQTVVSRMALISGCKGQQLNKQGDRQGKMAILMMIIKCEVCEIKCQLCETACDDRQWPLVGHIAKMLEKVCILPVYTVYITNVQATICIASCCCYCYAYEQLWDVCSIRSHS